MLGLYENDDDDDDDDDNDDDDDGWLPVALTLKQNTQQPIPQLNCEN